MVKYKLFQVKDNLTRDYGFMGLSMMKSLGVNVDFDNYNLVYDGEIEIDVDMTNILEEIFKIFNIEQPNDFYGRSMSVSDIVQINDDYFYCDSFGWENISNLIK